MTVIATAAPAPTPVFAVLEPRLSPTMPGFHLVFDDEFIGPTVNRKRWATSLPWGNTNPGEQQYYTRHALTQRGGMLTITASRSPTNGKPYASGAISSSERFAFSYGYAEIRAQVPPGAGLWSAFWLLSPVHNSNEEIDVLEVLGSDPSKGYAVLHFGTNSNKGKELGTYRNPDFSAGFHTFGLDWEPDRMVWYVDGVERYRVTQNIPSAPLFMVANLAVGGSDSWAGPPDRYTQFPADMNIDYIRVFQRN
jgi:beta-glucanase (GH16 family)